jgi:hypothetical protein
MVGWTQVAYLQRATIHADRLDMVHAKRTGMVSGNGEVYVFTANGARLTVVCYLSSDLGRPPAPPSTSST